MKIIFSDLKRGDIKVKVTNLDDLWYLSQIVDPEDIVKGETLRKIKLGETEQKVIRKPVFLSIKVEKTEFHTGNSMLRISGIITEGPEDVPKGTHHTFNVELNSIITVTKESWLDYQVEKIKEASTEQPKVLLVVFDREEAHFAYATSYGFEYLSELESDLPKKEEEKKTEGKYYHNIVEQIKTYIDRYKIERVVLASPAFWKDYVLEEVTDPELKKKIITATCSEASKTAFNEVLKRPEVQTALKESRVVKEMGLVEELLKEVMQGKKAAYGFENVKQAAESGAVHQLLLTDKYIQEMREKNEFGKVDSVLKIVDRAKGKIIIISSEHQGGKKLDGLGGIAALLRYQLE